MTTETIGRRIRDLRVKNGWTQEYLGESLGCSRVNVARLENNYRLPSDRVIADLCVIFGVSEQYLRTGRTEKSTPQFECSEKFRMDGRPKERCVAQMYPSTLIKVRALAREAGVTIPEALDQIVCYAIRNLET